MKDEHDIFKQTNRSRCKICIEASNPKLISQYFSFNQLLYVGEHGNVNYILKFSNDYLHEIKIIKVINSYCNLYHFINH